MGTRARCFFARFNRLKLSAPLVEASSGHPEILGQFVDALAGPHALYGHALELPGISFSSLHRLSSPGECAHHECANSRGHSITRPLSPRGCTNATPSQAHFHPSLTMIYS